MLFPFRPFSVLTIVASLCLTGLALAQQPGNGLTKDGDTYRHEASKSSFKLPQGWEVVDAKNITTQPGLAIRKPFGGVDVLITWTKLNDIRFEEAVETEVNELAKTYGKDKIAKKDPITIENKSIAVIEVNEGPDRNGKQMGMVYLFDAGPDARERWKIKVRAIINKTSQAEGVRSVSGILQKFQW